MAGSRLRRRTLRRPAVIMAACAAVSLASCTRGGESSESVAPERGAATITVTDAENGKTVSASVGDTVVVRLASNPSTGYSWKVRTQPDGSILKLAGTTYEAPGTDAVGAGGTDVWTFDAIGAGTTELALDYIGPGTDAEMGGSFSATITVGEPA